MVVNENENAQTSCLTFRAVETLPAMSPVGRWEPHNSRSSHKQQMALTPTCGRTAYSNPRSPATSVSPEIIQSSDVLVDLRLIDLKDTLKKGFIPIQETVDTKEPALRKRRLCVKLGLRVATKTAVCDIQIQGKSEHTPAHYTCIGELNNLGIWYRMRKVHPSTESYDSMSNTTRKYLQRSPPAPTGGAPAGLTQRAP
ncbi:unnamed protein product, partial [Coregonus sp. 'balchen']